MFLLPGTIKMSKVQAFCRLSQMALLALLALTFPIGIVRNETFLKVALPPEAIKTLQCPCHQAMPRFKPQNSTQINIILGPMLLYFSNRWLQV